MELKAKFSLLSHVLVQFFKLVGCQQEVSREETHNQIDHILVDRQKHWNVLDVRSFRAADCDSDHCLVVAKVKERLAVNKQRSHRFHMDEFNLIK
jgi:hypothetical protein